MGSGAGLTIIDDEGRRGHGILYCWTVSPVSSRRLRCLRLRAWGSSRAVNDLLAEPPTFELNSPPSRFIGRVCGGGDLYSYIHAQALETGRRQTQDSTDGQGKGQGDPP